MPFLRGLTVQRLRELATGAAASVIFSVAMTNALRIVSSFTLTRLLDPHAYGVVGVITSIAYMLAMLTDIGLLGFIVRHAEGDDPTFLDQVWTIRLLRGAGLTLLMILVSRPGAALLGKPELAPVVAVWSVSFLLDGLSSLAFAMAVRRKQLWRLSMMELSANVVTLAVSIICAILWRSYWALVTGMVMGQVAKTFLSYIFFPQTRHRIHISPARSAELWRFSRFIAMSSLLSLLIMQSDKLVLAKLMPLAVYGLYALAVTLSAAPGTIATSYATRVLYPVYSKTVREAPGTLRRVFYGARRKVALLYMFGVGGMLGSAQLIIDILYDSRYHGAAIYLRLIAISVALRMSSNPANEMLIAVGQMRVTFFANVCRVIWLAIGGAAGLITGKILLLIAIVGTVEVPGMLCYWVFLHREKLLSLREEGYGLAAAGAGAGLGLLASSAVFGLFPNL